MHVVRLHDEGVGHARLGEGPPDLELGDEGQDVGLLVDVVGALLLQEGLLLLAHRVVNLRGSGDCGEKNRK